MCGIGCLSLYSRLYFARCPHSSSRRLSCASFCSLYPQIVYFVYNSCPDLWYSCQIVPVWYMNSRHHPTGEWCTLCYSAACAQIVTNKRRRLPGYPMTLQLRIKVYNIKCQMYRWFKEMIYMYRGTCMICIVYCFQVENRIRMRYCSERRIYNLLAFYSY